MRPGNKVRRISRTPGRRRAACLPEHPDAGTVSSNGGSDLGPTRRAVLGV